ncbi:hypothetical protein [Parabacteroides pacaensis]|uniref:hypothetical protein n=1 Tax=Parabacteroides pacaensis TaxID=2086575 RepID=UPI00131C2DF9|nr:hypothetical protein [Parabacteroides pacaensis]
MKKYIFLIQYPAIGPRMKFYIVDLKAESINEALSSWLENISPSIFPLHLIGEIKEDAFSSSPTLKDKLVNVWADCYLCGKNFTITHIIAMNLQEQPIYKYTFIASYKDWNFLSQIEGTDPLNCLHTWVKNNTKYYPKHGMEKIQSLLNNSSFLPLQKISEGIWLFRYRFYKDYVLEIHIADTVVDQEEYPSEWD